MNIAQAEKEITNNPQQFTKPKTKPDATQSLTWQGSNYTHVTPGTYTATGSGHQGPEWCRQFHRWSIRIQFELLDGSGSVSRFFNMGSNADSPAIGRNSLYFKAWTLANGEMPRRGQAMSPEVFCEGQIFEIRVEDARLDSQQKDKGESEIYSRVAELISARRAQSSNHSIIQSVNQESSNHPIRQSTNQVGLTAKDSASPHKLRPGRAGAILTQGKPKVRGSGSAQASFHSGGIQ